MVREIKKEFASNLKTVRWMSSYTKKKAREKVHNFYEFLLYLPLFYLIFYFYRIGHFVSFLVYFPTPIIYVNRIIVSHMGHSFYVDSCCV